MVSVGGKLAADIAQSVTDTEAATALNIVSTIVKRDASGNIYVSQINGVTIESHASRHLPNGSDPITTAAPSSDLSATTSNATGSANSLARSDHSHAIDTGSPSTQNPDQANSTGSSANLARADHVHNIPTAVPVQIDADGSNLQGAATTFSRADHKHNIATSSPSTQNPDQVNSPGTSSSLARADHIHNIPTSTPIQINADGNNSQGSSTSFAKADHKHDIAAGTPVTQNTDQSNSAGSSSNLARADHVHNIPTAAPIQINADGTNTQGSSTSFAKADHKHDIATGSPVSVGTANAAGSASSLAKSDHTHQGVHSVKANAGAQRFGDLSINSGTGTTVVDDGSGNFTVNSTITQYTDELAQDAVGNILTDTNSIDFTYNDPSNLITADLKLSAAAADVNNFKSTTTIKSDGLHVENPIATGSQTGVISSTDWTTFNNKEPAQTKGTISSSTAALSVTNGTSSTVGPNVGLSISTVTSSQDGLMFANDKTKLDGLALDRGFFVSQNQVPNPQATTKTIATSQVYGSYTVSATGSGPIAVTVTNTSTGAQVGTVNLSGTVTGTAVSLVISSPYAYVLSSTGYVAIVDLTTPSAPSALGLYATGSTAPSDLSVYNNQWCYVASKLTTNSIRVLDVNNKSSISQVFSYNISMNLTSISPIINVFGTNVWVTYASTATRYARNAYAITTGTGALGSAQNYEKGRQVLISGTTAYVSINANPGSVSIFDISNRYSAVFKSTFTYGGGSFNGPIKMAIDHTYLYVTASGGHLSILDVSNPLAIASLATIFPGGATLTNATSVSVASTGNTAYVTRLGSGAQNSSLFVIDVTNKSSPSVSSTIDYGNASTGYHAFDTQIVGNYLYVTAYARTGGAGKLDIYDISTPTSPSLVGNLAFGTNLGNLVVSSTGNYAYVNDQNTPGNTYIIDISNKTAPAQLSTFAQAAGVFGAIPYGLQVVDDTFLYYQPANTNSNWTDIYDISVKTAPVKFLRLNNLNVEPGSFAVAGDYIYYANRSLLSLDTYSNILKYENFGNIAGNKVTANSFIGSLTGNVNGVDPAAHASRHLPSGADPITTAAPTVNLDAATTNATGTANSLARSDHSHAISTGAASTQTPDQTNAAGSSANLAKADHVHNIPTAAPIQINADGTNTQGVATTFSRADHKHDVLTAAPTVNLDAATTNATGTANSLARSDHSHAISTGAASTQTPDQANAAGSSANLAKADHIHNIPSGVPVQIGTSNFQGAAASFALSDHVHSHGSQTNGSLHAAATTSVNGFMSSGDKTKLDASTASNTPSALVQRDSSGNFSAGTITADLSGTATNFSGSLSGDVTGTQSSTAIADTVVTGKVLTGFAAGPNSAIAATDSILDAFDKTQGQINNKEPTITGSGNILDYYAGDKTFRALPITGITNYFFYKTASDIATYYRAETGLSAGAAQTFTSASLPSGDTVLVTFATDPNYPNVSLIQSGIASVYITGRQSAGNKTTHLYANIYKIDSAGGSPVLLTSTNIAPDFVPSGSDQSYALQGAIGAVVIANPTDRIRVDIIANVSGGGSSPTVVLTVEDNTAARLTMPASTANFTGNLYGDVTGNQNATVVSLVGGSTAANVHSAELAANAATNINTASAIVKRDASGNFAASAVSASSVVVRDSGSFTVTLTASTMSGSYGWSLPATQGGTGTFLSNDGAGNLTWSNPVVNIDGGNATSNYVASLVINGGTP